MTRCVAFVVSRLMAVVLTAKSQEMDAPWSGASAVILFIYTVSSNGLAVSRRSSNAQCVVKPGNSSKRSTVVYSAELATAWKGSGRERFQFIYAGSVQFQR
eukprot:TRINITY_DN3385_c0_g1_i1.p3 TRINITY_DN3385_c0_g1~~TRINITY_DN3385_c0_g1_i1.p3  ORF type:complete len:101 (+),score=14.08 TRINITY_DN3385_c0_g1_i1:208-510(+)